MNSMFRSARIVPPVLLVLCLVAGTGQGSAAMAGPGREDSPEPVYASGRLLVKVTVQAGEQLARVVEREGEPFSGTAIPVAALKEASIRSQVKSWRRLVPNAPREDPSGIGRVYLLTLDPGADVMSAVQTFGALSGWVEYAEPDAMAEIQRNR